MVPVQLTQRNAHCDTRFGEAFAEFAEKPCPIALKLAEFRYD